MDIKDRILKYLAYKGVSATKAESELGWGKGGFFKAKSISADKAGEFLLHYDDLSAEWLMREKGSMISGEASSLLIARINKLEGQNELLREMIGLGINVKNDTEQKKQNAG